MTRFRRTKEEVALGLSAEQALERRLAGKTSTPVGKITNNGQITVIIRPATGTDHDYFEFVPSKQVEVTLPQNWYSWFDNRMQVPYDGDVSKLLEHILCKGMEVVLSTIHFKDDLTLL